MSIEFYDLNADRFYADTVIVDMESLYERFLTHIPKSGSILDVGCGSGRDSLAFSRRGYRVDAFDGSIEMVKRASNLTGLSVRHMLFEEFAAAWNSGPYDGVWACASLLHVERSNLPNIIHAIFSRTKPGGVVYLSFKHGQQDRTKDGRRFTDLDQVEIGQLVATAGGQLVEPVWITQDNRPGRDETWVNALATNPG
jgi:2-polyprenyl-3-methyl-5-hydroxy-6-metoxy-1,4-benzoquinol methylase